jgi:hypothetical protein
VVQSHEAEKRNLELEISGYKQEAAKQRKLIYELEKERDRHVTDMAIITQRSLDVRVCVCVQRLLSITLSRTNIK